MNEALPTATHCHYCKLPIRVSGAIAAADDSQPVYCCYGCSFAANITQQHGERGQTTWMLTRLGVAGFLTMCVMMCSIYLYGREVYDRTPATEAVSANIAQILRYASLLLSTPVLYLLGIPILQAAWSQWRMRIVSTDALVVLGVVSAYVYSYVATLRGGGATYFETTCMILVLVTLGRWFEAVGKLHATERVKSLDALVPAEVSVLRESAVLIVRPDDVLIGDILLVKAGDRISVDGVVESGRANIDEQIVTGESATVVKQRGDAIRAGTMSLDGALTIRATAVGRETTLGRLVALLESARASKGRYERLADRVATHFLPLTLVIAIIAAIAGFARGGANEAIMTSLSVLLIACPCGLGIATPMAVWMALGRAASAGAMFRSGTAIEALARVRTVFFDKTGTLTTGLPHVALITTDIDIPREAVLARAAGLALSSRHAVSRALVDLANQCRAMPVRILNVTTLAGRGLLGFDGPHTVRLGNQAMMDEASLKFSPLLRAALDDAMSAGRSVVCIGWAGRVTGVFQLVEALRPEAAAALRGIRDLGCHVAILTGDHVMRGRSIAREMNVEAYAGLLPADKVNRIALASHDDKLTAMVGDGLNDAPAMAAADVGIAMGCGADLTREAAAICLMGNDLSTLPWLIALARRTIRTVKVNLFWVFFYNGIGLALAASGRLSPVIAAIAMVASSLFVIGNSLRLNASVVGSQQEAKAEASPVERIDPAMISHGAVS